MTRFAFFGFLLCLAACSSTTWAPVTTRVAQDTNPPVATQPSAQPKAQHTVGAGDTLYSIAWRYGLDYRDIARWNGITGPYVIYPKQRLRLRAPATKTSPATKAAPPAESAKKQEVKRVPKPQAVQSGKKPTDKKSLIKPKASKAARPKASSTAAGNSAPPPSIKWRWPAQGKLLRFTSPIAKKGISIGGRLGQEIKAAAGGDVVYSGSGLLGYGKLIILKHNDTFLSAYAHNSEILVKEGERVRQGQQIAAMGLGNEGRALLHFEIRKNGKPVDPMTQLPRQRS